MKRPGLPSAASRIIRARLTNPDLTERDRSQESNFSRSLLFGSIQMSGLGDLVWIAPLAALPWILPAFGLGPVGVFLALACYAPFFVAGARLISAR